MPQKIDNKLYKNSLTKNIQESTHINKFKELIDDVYIDNTPIIKEDTRSKDEVKSSRAAMKEYNDPSLSTQSKEVLQKPLRYLAEPNKAIGDLADALLGEKNPISEMTGTTKEDVLKNRYRSLNPYVSKKDKLKQTINEAGELGVSAGLNVLTEGILSEAPAVTSIYKNNLRKGVYNNVAPIGYEGKLKSIKKAFKDANYDTFISGKERPLVERTIDDYIETGFVSKNELPYGLSKEEFVKNREEAWRKYLDLSKESDNLYVRNSDGSFSYNNSRLSNKSKENFMSQNMNQSGGDYLTGNGGRIGKIEVTPVIDKSSVLKEDLSEYVMKDTWDLHPFKKKNVPDKIKNIEVGEFLGIGKPFDVKHKEIGSKIFKQGQDVFDSKLIVEPYNPNRITNIVRDYDKMLEKMIKNKITNNL